MKKIFSLLLISMLMFMLCACAKTESTDTSEQNHDHTHISETLTAEGGAAEVDSSEADGDSQNTNTSTENTGDKDVPGNENQNSDGKVDVDGDYKRKQMDKIDVPCAEELNLAQSDAVKKTIYDKYALEWEIVYNRYYDQLLQINGSVPATENYTTAEELHTYLDSYKEEWEDGFEQICSVFRNQMTEGADNIGVELQLAQITYESNRELALYFIGIYEDIETFSNQNS